MRILATTRYIDGDQNGWLRIKLEPLGEEISLPEYLLVDFMYNKSGRDYFKILEGSERGNKCSVKQGNLKSGSPDFGAGAKLEFSLSKETLTYRDGKIKAITYAENPIALGVYPVQIPDFPHPGGAGYLSKSSYAKSWFYLGYGKAISGKNDRYLHTGLRSAGCVTVDPEAWTKLYKYLIICRSGDANNVGMLAVVS